MDGWGGHSYGDGSWAEPPYYGSEKFVFIEDNCFNDQSGNEFAGVVDCWRGGRYVLRYNHVYDVPIAQTHGTEIGRERGARCMEVYSNDYHWTVSRNIRGARSGGLISHDNTHDGVQPERGNSVGAYRVFFTFLGSPFTERPVIIHGITTLPSRMGDTLLVIRRICSIAGLAQQDRQGTYRR